MTQALMADRHRPGAAVAVGSVSAMAFGFFFLAGLRAASPGFAALAFFRLLPEDHLQQTLDGDAFLGHCLVEKQMGIDQSLDDPVVLLGQAVFHPG